MTKNLFAALSVSLLLMACHTGSGTAPAEDAGQPALLLDGRQYEHYGLGVHEGDTVEVGAVMADPAAFDGKQLTIHGSIADICKHQGCWARVGDGQQKLFVKMADHAFLLPTDCEGRDVTVAGQLRIKVQSVEELRHYAEDAGKSAEEINKITEPKRVVEFIASGVALQKKG